MKRKNWGRIVFTLFGSAISVAMLIFIFLYADVNLKRILEFTAQTSPDDVEKYNNIWQIANIQTITQGVLVITLIWAYTKISIRLNSKSVRKLF